LVFVGSPSVGKSALIKVFCGEEFPANYYKTASPQLSYHRIPFKDAQKVEPFVYDLPSDELYERGWGRIEAEADAQVYVYDVTRKETLEDVVNKWTTKLRGQCIEDVPSCPGVLIGNKSDLSCRREVSASAGVEVAESLGLQFMETSAKDNRGVVFQARGVDEHLGEDGVVLEPSSGAGGRGEGKEGFDDPIGAVGKGGVAAAPADGNGGDASCYKGSISDALSFFLRHLKSKTGDGKKDKDLIQLENVLNIN